MSLIKWKPLNNEIDTFDNIIDQFFNDLSFDPRFSLMNTNNVSNYYSENEKEYYLTCLLYTSPSPRDKRQSRMPSSA